MDDRGGSTRPAPSGGSVRPVVEFVVCLLVTVMLFRTWFIESFVVPSSSMADSLVGLHREVLCDDCGHRFPCGTDDLAMRELRAVCPNCGYPENDLTDEPDVNGDRLVVFKSAFALRAPRRWEVVVFRFPEEARKVFIKRVVGLPGESVQIRGGDVYVDGQIQRKTLDQQRALAVLVHDSRSTATSAPTLPPRWQGEAGRTRWRTGAGRFYLPGPDEEPDVADDAAIDWLTYRHWRRVPGFSDRVEEVPIVDDYGYNQSRPQTIEDDNLVTDLLLSCRVRTTGRGKLSFYATAGTDQFLIHLEPSTGRVELLHNGRQVSSAQIGHAVLQDETLVEFSIVDRQVLLALDGRLALEPYPYQAADLPAQPTSRPMAVGARNLGVYFSDLRLFRDVYYTDPGRPYGRWALDQPYALADDEYFMLGDNSPLSEDSRLWVGGPGVASHLLVGKPLVVHLPSRLVRFGSTTFQVPDLLEIRYIR